MGTTFYLSFRLSNGHMGCFRLLVTVNHAAMNINVQISIWVLPSVLWCIDLGRNGVTGSYGNSVFDFLKKHQTAFHRVSASLHSQWQGTGSNFSKPSPPLVVFCNSFLFTHLSTLSQQFSKLAVLKWLRSDSDLVVLNYRLFSAPKEHLTTSENVFSCHDGGRVLLASSG